MGLIKTAAEIASIEHSLQITSGAFSLVEDILRSGTIKENNTIIYDSIILTSEFLHEKVRKYFDSHNFSLPEGLIISSGLHSAEPHHPGMGAIIAGTPIVADIFPKDNQSGYFADITRTYVKGRPQPEVAAMYAAVWKSHQASLAVLKAGLKAHEPYDKACDVLQATSYDVNKEKGFVHSLGHGLGTEVHEAPRLGRGDETVLEADMVITIEPGLYYKNIGGIRIEDTVLITEDGYTQLTKVPYTWQIA